MEALFGMASLALAASILIAARFWFKDRPAHARSADILSMLAATLSTGFIALGIGSVVDFLFRSTGVWFWIEAGLALLAVAVIAAVAIYTGSRIGLRRSRPLA